MNLFYNMQVSSGAQSIEVMAVGRCRFGSLFTRLPFEEMSFRCTDGTLPIMKE